MAKTIITRRSQREESGILEGYPFKDIRHILTPIGGTLHILINLTPLNNLSHIGGIIKKLSLCRALYLISHILQTINLHTSGENLP